MDGPHDLGGKQGFGAIDVDAPPFRHDWEERQWALSKNARALGGTLDWWRATMELMPPAAYLSEPYFVKWCLNDLVQAIDKGDFTLEEVLSGTTDRPGPPAEPRDLAGALDRLRADCADFERPATAPPLHDVGDRVMTLRHGHSGHTRLPAYGRGAPGVVIAHHGAHVFADSDAAGVEDPKHLYTVAFAAPDLWGDEGDPRDAVHLDLWEPYLVPA